MVSQTQKSGPKPISNGTKPLGQDPAYAQREGENLWDYLARMPKGTKIVSAKVPPKK